MLASRRQEVSQTLLPWRGAKQSHTTCKKRITFDKARHVKFQPVDEYTNTFRYASFWYDLNSNLLQTYGKKFRTGVKYRLKCLENWSVIQRPKEGAFKFILEKEGGSKAVFKGSETQSLSVSRGVPLAALLRLKRSALSRWEVHFPNRLGPAC